MSPLTASLWSLVPSVGVGVAVGTSSALAGKVRPAALMGGGFLVGAAGFALMTQVGAHSRWRSSSSRRASSPPAPSAP